MSKEIYTIELDRPDGVSVAELAAYIKEAVEDWGGQRPDSDPLFYPWKIKGADKDFNKRRAPMIRVRRSYP